MTSSLLVSSPASVSPFARRALAFTGCLAMFFYAAYLGAIGVLLPAVGETFGQGVGAQGRLFPANFAGFTLVVLVAGSLSDRLNRKMVLMAGIGLFALGLLLFSRASSFDFALVASVLIGGGSGAVGVTSSALAADLYPHRRAHILAAIQIAFGLGAALGPGLSSVLLHQHVSWRLLYAGLAFVNFGLLFGLQSQTAPDRETPKDRKPAPSILHLLRQRPVQIMCVFQILYAGAEVGFFSWMPSYFEKQLPKGAVFAGSVVTIFWIAMTVGRTITGKFLGRMPFMRLSAILAFAGAICATLTLLWHTPLVVMLFVILTGLCLAGIYILLSAEASERYPDTIGAIFGCIVAVGGLGTAILPWLVGAVAATSAGWAGGLAIIPCAALGVAICSLLLQKVR